MIVQMIIPTIVVTIVPTIVPTFVQPTIVQPTIVQTIIQAIIQTAVQTTAQTIVQKSCYLGRLSVNGSKIAPNCLGSFMILKVSKVFSPLWALFSLRMLANEHGIQQKIWLLIAAHKRGGL